MAQGPEVEVGTRWVHLVVGQNDVPGVSMPLEKWGHYPKQWGH